MQNKENLFSQWPQYPTCLFSEQTFYLIQDQLYDIDPSKLIQ